MQTDFWVFDPASDTAQWTELRHITNYSSDAYDDGYTNYCTLECFSICNCR